MIAERWTESEVGGRKSDEGGGVITRFAHGGRVAGYLGHLPPRPPAPPPPTPRPPPPSRGGTSARGSFIWNRAPMVGVGSAVRVPPWAATMRLARYSPIPSPEDPGPRAKRSKRRGKSSGGIPGPWSETVTTVQHPAPVDSTSSSTTTVAPAGENLMALETTFSNAWRIRLGSTEE